jgi:hypothetical protein
LQSSDYALFLAKHPSFMSGAAQIGSSHDIAFAASAYHERGFSGWIGYDKGLGFLDAWT